MKRILAALLCLCAVSISNAQDWRNWGDKPKARSGWRPASAWRDPLPEKAVAVATSPAVSKVETPAAKTETPAAVAETVQYMDVPQYDRRGRFVGTVRQQVVNGGSRVVSGGS